MTNGLSNDSFGFKRILPPKFLLVREGAKSPVSKRKLLLADDSITIQKVVNLTFADEGIEVISVSDGDAAMLKFNESMPDLVMADVNMPGLDGYRMCEMIKQDDETKHIPVILLVGSFEPFDEQEAWRVGADDFLTKPFQSIRQLVTKVSDLLNAPAETENETEISGLTAAAESEQTNDWQFADTKEFPAEELERENLGDTGMDDEMIQTSQVDEPVPYDEVQKFISDSYSYRDETEKTTEQEDLTGQSFEDESAEDFALLEPIEETESERISDENFVENLNNSDSKIYDLAEYEIKEDAEESNEIVESENESVSPDENAEETDSTGQINIFADDADKTENVSDWQFVNAELQEIPDSTESEDLEEDNETENITEAETAGYPANEYIEVSGDATEVDSTEDDTDIEDSTEEYPAEKESDNLTNETASTVAFDDLDLLELPPLVEETGIRPQPKYKEPEPVAAESEINSETSETAENVETAAASEKDNEAQEISAQSFPPELIEAIAQKVAERISDKTIREIAWEVVPQMTDLIVKKIAEEQFERNAKELKE